MGYSNQGGIIFNLLRDDRGHRDDISKVNYEIAYTRGMPAGEYIVNLHLYRNMSEQLPIPVTVVASAKPNPKVSSIRLVKSEIKLDYLNQEVTVFRFTLNEHGMVVPGSVHTTPKSLRTASK